MSIKQQAAKGVMWNTIERFSSQGIQFVLTIVIARILSPDDYGLVAMLSIFMAIAQTLIDSGFGNALIQKKDRDEADYSTTFYFNILVSSFIYLILFLMAPWIATFYSQPTLISITRVFGLVLVINSFSIVQQARLTVVLDFKKQAFASLLSVVAGGAVGVWMAYHDFGVWTLVWQALISAVCRSLVLWIYARWMPHWLFSWTSFRSLFSFGSKIMLSAMLHTIYTNMYSLVVGKVFNAVELGYFNRAYTLGQFPVQNFSNIVFKVVYPIQCRYQNDKEKFNYLFVNSLRLSCFFIFPLMTGIVILAGPLVQILLTDKWLPIVPLLQIVCIAQMWDPVMRLNASVLDATGRSDYRLYSEILKKVVAFAILFLSIPFGIRVMCVGLVLYSFADMVIIIGYSRKITGIGYRRQFRSILPFTLLAAGAGGLTWIVLRCISSLPDLLQIAIGSIIGVVSYGIGAYLFKFPEWEMIYSKIKNYKR